eukprot:22600-Prymnesium_polylepis.1
MDVRKACGSGPAAAAGGGLLSGGAVRAFLARRGASGFFSSSSSELSRAMTPSSSDVPSHSSRTRRLSSAFDDGTGLR